ncbi:MAG TPA: NUDIX domain-containing protein [Candidatus Paceibacterota bacterium]
MTHTYIAGGVVLNKKGEVLIVNQLGLSWSLPKGHIEEGEDELAAAKREIFEESGISQLSVIKRLGSYDRARIALDVTKEDKREIRTITLFLFTTPQMTLEPRDAENPEARWVPRQEVTDYLTHRKDRYFFKNIIPEIDELFPPK